MLNIARLDGSIVHMSLIFGMRMENVIPAMALITCRWDALTFLNLMQKDAAINGMPVNKRICLSLINSE